MDPALLCLWSRLAAVAPVRPLAWESPYAMGEALKRQKTPPPKKREREDRCRKKNTSTGSGLGGWKGGGGQRHREEKRGRERLVLWRPFKSLV